MTDRKEIKKLAWMIAAFAAIFFLPVGWERFRQSIFEALHLTRWYAREHVVLCLLPAFFIAGAIGVFISNASVMKYLGAKAPKALAYGVASVSGSVLAVCSCTVLPLFAGIWRMGAGLGPAVAFLYSGPAINVLAIILTARILGMELGIARAVGAVVFSVVIGLIMHLIYRREEHEKAQAAPPPAEDEEARPLWQNAVFFALMAGVLVLANWGRPSEVYLELKDGRSLRGQIVEAPFDPSQPGASYTIRTGSGDPAREREIEVTTDSILSQRPLSGPWAWIWLHKWWITSALALAVGAVLILWLDASWWRVLLGAIAVGVLALALPSGGLWVLLPFFAGIAGLCWVLAASPQPGRDWLGQTWSFTKQILPLLLIGVLVAGFLLGRPGHSGLIPPRYVQMLVGNSPDAMLEMTGWDQGGFEALARALWPVWSNFFAAIFGALMYFATLTEVPILQGLIGAGMGKGPALALLLAGPAVSLPNLLVIRGILGTRKTLVFCMLVVVMATTSGLIYGAFF